MKRHLSAQQISEWTVGERSWASSEHVRECAACRAEIEGLESTLAAFRGSVRHWTERESEAIAGQTILPAADFQPASRRLRIFRPPGLRLWWAAVAVAVVLLAVLTTPRAPKAVSNGDVAIADATLLRQVDSELSRAIPSPMEPLTRLVSWEPGGSQREAQ